MKMREGRILREDKAIYYFFFLTYLGNGGVWQEGTRSACLGRNC